MIEWCVVCFVRSLNLYHTYIILHFCNYFNHVQKKFLIHLAANVEDERRGARALKKGFWAGSGRGTSREDNRSS